MQLDPALYWELRAKIADANMLKRNAEDAVAKADAAIAETAQRAGLNISKVYTFDDRSCTATEAAAS